MKTTLITAGLLACALAAPAVAQTVKMQPGLWQLVGSLKSQSGTLEKAIKEAQARLAGLPPEQRKAIEQMLAAKGVGLADSGTILKVCITPEAAERGYVPLQSGDCPQQVVSQEGNTLRVSFTCRTEPPSSGRGEISFLSPTSNKAKATIDTVVNGKPEQLQLTQDGSWLGADCGGIAPLGTGR